MKAWKSPAIDEPMDCFFEYSGDHLLDVTYLIESKNPLHMLKEDDRIEQLVRNAIRDTEEYYKGRLTPLLESPDALKRYLSGAQTSGLPTMDRETINMALMDYKFYKDYLKMKEDDFLSEARAWIVDDNSCVVLLYGKISGPYNAFLLNYYNYENMLQNYWQQPSNQSETDQTETEEKVSDRIFAIPEGISFGMTKEEAREVVEDLNPFEYDGLIAFGGTGKRTSDLFYPEVVVFNFANNRLNAVIFILEDIDFDTVSTSLTADYGSPLHQSNPAQESGTSENSFSMWQLKDCILLLSGNSENYLQAIKVQEETVIDALLGSNGNSTGLQSPGGYDPEAIADQLEDEETRMFSRADLSNGEVKPLDAYLDNMPALVDDLEMVPCRTNDGEETQMYESIDGDVYLLCPFYEGDTYSLSVYGPGYSLFGLHCGMTTEEVAEQLRNYDCEKRGSDSSGHSRQEYYRISDAYFLIISWQNEVVLNFFVSPLND